MADSKRNEIQNALQIQVEDVEKRYIRPLQREMYECSAKCCESSNSSTDQVNQCLQNCTVKMSESHNYVISQFNSYQERLQRCVSQCNDEAKDQLMPTSSEADIEKVSQSFEKCACMCIDKHMALLPQFMAKMHQVLSQKTVSSSSSSQHLM